MAKLTFTSNKSNTSKNNTDDLVVSQRKTVIKPKYYTLIKISLIISILCNIVQAILTNL